MNQFAVKEKKMKLALFVYFYSLYSGVHKLLQRFRYGHYLISVVYLFFSNAPVE